MDVPSLSSNFKFELESKMEKIKAENGLKQRGAFVPDDFIMELFTKENIREDAKKNLDLDDLDHLVQSKLIDAIHDSARKLYSILVLLNEPRRVKKLVLVDPPINDEVLFEMEGGTYKSACSPETLKGIPELEEIADKFYKKQWHFPPSFPPEETPKFPADLFMFPFLSVQREPIGAGGFGVVMEAEIAPGYLRFSKEHDIISTIAYKRIKYEGDEGWKNVKEEVNTLRERQHPHVTPLLASFIAGLECPNNPHFAQECIYMISPLAEMDMNEWLYKEPPLFTGLDENRLRNHIYFDAMLGLISGVAYIHREINGIVGYHRDLKPKNLLLFVTQSAWEWKICDFGCANLKPFYDTGTTSFTTTPYWAPPELMKPDAEQDGQRHGRAHDVYSLGCVFLLLATVVHFRWDQEGIKEFEKRRSAIDNGGPEVKGATQPSKEKGAFHNNPTAVHNWIRHLESKADRKHSKRVLEIIEQMLLPREERISSWEAEVYLYDAIEDGRPEHEVLRRLKEVVQKSRDIDLKMTQTPVTRVIKWRESERKQRDGRRRSDEFFKEFLDVLKAARWHDHSPQTTFELRKRTKRVKEYFSTLPSIPKSGRLFGCQGVLKSIAQEFGKSDTVAISGMGGIGKSQVALHYASQFTNSRSDARKHAFWVSADSHLYLENSYRDIAKATGIYDQGHASRYTLANYVKQWLEGENGQWILVVDGFDIRPTAKEIENYLPKRGCGQILITTRNRQLVRNLVEKPEACLELRPPDLEDRLRIFQHYIDKTILAKDTSHTTKLLEILCLPKLIEDVAYYMNANEYLCSEMLKDILKDGLSAMEPFSQDIADYLLRPLIPKVRGRLKDMEPMPIEAQWLFLFAFLDTSGIRLDLAKIEIHPEKHSNYRDMLATLHNCDLISKLYNEGEVLHSINRVVQLAVHAWVKKTKGDNGLLERYNKTLSMLYRYYDKWRKEFEKQKQGSPLGVAACLEHPFIYKRQLMPHFEPFRKFITEAHPKGEGFNFSDRAIQALLIFSRVLIDQDQFDDAITILEFGKAHYPLPNPENLKDKFERKTNIRLELVGQLVRAYLSHSFDLLVYQRVEGIVREELEEAAYSDKSLESGGGKSVAMWKLTLDLLRLYWKSARFDAAKEELDRMDKITIRSEKNQPILASDKDWGAEQNGGITDEMHMKLHKRRRLLRRLGIQVKKEEGNLYFAQGREHEIQNDLDAARQSWLAARSAFEIAREALREWFNKDYEQLEEVTLAITDTDIMLGTAKGLQDAYSHYETALKRAKEIYGCNCQRVWDIECSINAVKLRQKQQVSEAVDSLERLLDRYANKFSTQDPSTIRCASQLREGYVQLGRWNDVKNLSERIVKMPSYEHRKSIVRETQWGATGALLLGGSSAAFVGAILIQSLRSRR